MNERRPRSMRCERPPGFPSAGVSSPEATSMGKCTPSTAPTCPFQIPPHDAGGGGDGGEGRGVGGGGKGGSSGEDVAPACHEVWQVPRLFMFFQMALATASFLKRTLLASSQVPSSSPGTCLHVFICSVLFLNSDRSRHPPHTPDKSYLHNNFRNV